MMAPEPAAISAAATSDAKARVSAGPLRSAMVGGILGVDAAGVCLALATICFGGTLVAGLSLATGVFLMVTIIVTLALHLFGAFRQALGITQDTSIAILAPAAIAAGNAVTGPPEAQVITAMAVLGTSAMLSGLTFWLVGHFRLGQLIRRFPFPVAAGFLASSGVLLLLAAGAILTGAGDLPDMARAVLDPRAASNLLPAVMMAVTLLVIIRMGGGTNAVLLVLAAALGGFYLVLGFLDLGRADAIALGLLPDIASEGGMRIAPGLLAQIDWSRVAAAGPTLAVVIVINLIGVLLNTSGVDLVARQMTDVNRELRITGLANILGGAMGSITGFLQGGATILGIRLGVQGRAMVTAHCLVLLTALFFVTEIVASVPTFLAGGLLLFIGMVMIDDWLIGIRRKLVASDRAIVMGIVATTILVGILPAVAIGLALAVASFAIGYARLPILRRRTDARRRRSVRDRSPDALALLEQAGERIVILQLQGTLFFGSVEQLITGFPGLTPGTDPVEAVILDFSEVHAVDSAACAALGKLGYLTARQRITVHLASVSAPVLEVFRRWGLDLKDGVPDNDGPRGAWPGEGQLVLWPDLDRALEHCEDGLLGDGHNAPPVPVTGYLAAMGDDHPRVPDLVALLTPTRLVRGEPMIDSASGSQDIYFIESGRLAVWVTSPDAPRLRVRSIGPGAVVGEIAFLLQRTRTADVVADTDALVHRLDADTIRTLQRDDRDLAALLMAILARATALKVTQSNMLLSHATRPAR